MPFPHGYAEDALYNAVNLCVHAVNNLRYALSLKMSIITYAMMERNCAISGRKAKNRTAIPRRWKYTAVRTAAAVSINPNIFTDTMRKRIQTAIKS